jgi:hypothetical protein
MAVPHQRWVHLVEGCVEIHGAWVLR